MTIKLKKTIKALVKEEFELIASEALLAETVGRTQNIFWLVTSINPKNRERMLELASGKLTGVKGISDNKKIVMHWFGIGRNAILVMPSKELLNLNKDIHQIDYGNPHELLYDDMKLLSRIWDKQHRSTYGRRGVMSNLSDYIVKILVKDSDSDINKIGFSIRSGFNDLERNVPEINSPKELAFFVRERILESSNLYDKEKVENLSLQWWEDVISRAIVNSVKTYESEGEWIIASDTLTIPNNSNLVIGVTATPEDFPEEQREKLKDGTLKGFTGITRKHINSAPIIMAVYENNLDKKYNVKFIDMNKFEKVQTKLQVRHFSL